LDRQSGARADDESGHATVDIDLAAAAQRRAQRGAAGQDDLLAAAADGPAARGLSATAGAATPAELTLYATASNSLRRLLESVGLERRARDVTCLRLRGFDANFSAYVGSTRIFPGGRLQMIDAQPIWLAMGRKKPRR
jgi:hypothetical protein